jgi:hypothetical protein
LQTKPQLSKQKALYTGRKTISPKETNVEKPMTERVSERTNKQKNEKRAEAELTNTQTETVDPRSNILRK